MTPVSQPTTPLSMDTSTAPSAAPTPDSHSIGISENDFSPLFGSGDTDESVADDDDTTDAPSLSPSHFLEQNVPENSFPCGGSNVNGGTGETNRTVAASFAHVTVGFTPNVPNATSFLELYTERNGGTEGSNAINTAMEIVETTSGVTFAFFFIVIGLAYIYKKKNIWKNASVLMPCIPLLCNGLLLALVLSKETGVALIIMLTIPVLFTLWLVIVKVFVPCAKRLRCDDIERIAEQRKCAHVDDEAKGKAGSQVVKLKGEDVYSDLTARTARAVVLGFTQVAMIYFYVDGIFKKLIDIHTMRLDEECDYEADEGCVKRDEYVFYYWTGVGVAFGYLIGNDYWKAPFTAAEFWKKVWILEFASWNKKQVKEEEDKNNDTRAAFTWPPLSDVPASPDLHACRWIRFLELLIRCFCSLVVNTGGLLFITLALPFQVASGPPGAVEVIPLDFVLNVVAAFFIVEIDNTDPTEFVVRVGDVTSQKDDSTTDSSESNEQKQKRKQLRGSAMKKVDSSRAAKEMKDAILPV